MALTKTPRSLSSTPSIIDNGTGSNLTINSDGSIEFNTAGVTISATGELSTTSESYATQAYVDTELANLVDSAPGALDTLNELAAALDDDPNFAVTITNSIATKAPLADPSFTGTVDVTGTITADGITSNLTGNVTGDLTGELDLSAISSTINDTAVDIFVYDTRKDSDGGAWRKRTQHTSWYNETLNTATRGSRREFPAVAILVHTGSTIKIYDGDDPDMPLWGHYSNLTQDSGFAASVTARDGSIFGSQRATSEVYSGNGWYQLNFVADYFFSNLVGTYGSLKQGRHDSLLTTNNYTLLGDRTTPLYVSPLAVNDLAVTVLPNAPIDTTGLPVPTIALATDGGVSVIKDDGSVVDWSSLPINSIRLTKDYMYTTYGGNGRVYVDPIPTKDLANYPGGQSAGVERHYRAFVDVLDPEDDDLVYLSVGDEQLSNNDITLTGKDSLATGTQAGVTLLKENETKPSMGMVNYITSDYNTGWINGDIKLATLSDTDDTDVTGGSLLTGQKSTYDVDTSTPGWNTQPNATVTHSSGNGKDGGNAVAVTSSGGSNIYASLDTGLSLTSGKQYILQFDIRNSSGTAASVINASQNAYNTGTQYGSILTSSDNLSTTYQTVYFTFTASTANLNLNVYAGLGNNIAVYLDNIQVYEAEPDRSVNNNGLQVFGTVQKNPVATGADLVAYSGFSTSDYFEQPYSSDLDFGTDDFCMMGWAKTSSDAENVHETYMSRAGRAFDISKTTLENYRFYITPSTYISTSTIIYDQWVHLVAVRRNGTSYIYVNGEQEASGEVTTSIGSGYSDDDQLMVGVRRASGLSQPSDNSELALWRISSTAPTPDQIKKIYEDEKVLFQENAKATLYGTSDAVTALAYDDDTNLLHVGTSDGRSVFQGLRRIDNTTDAVTTAISASNGLVVEE